MLRRQRQIRTQFYRLLDAALFALSFWLAHIFRQDNAFLARLGGPVHIQPFASWQVSYLDQYAPLLVVIGLVSPLLLEIHGFYSRPLITSRRRTIWQLSRGCTLTVLVLIVVLFLFNFKLARS